MCYNTDVENDQAKSGSKILFVLAGTVVGIVAVRALQPQTALLPLSKLIDPASVKPIADDIADLGGDFTLAAWQYVGGTIDYRYYGSDLHFQDSSVKCQNCMLPMQVAQKGYSNCVGKAALLTSILRDRYGPDDAYMVVGEYLSSKTGKDNGHAWVNLKRNGIFYVIEATSLPPQNPWVSANSLSEIYVPDAWVNDAGLICYDPEVCTLDFSVSKYPCNFRFSCNEVSCPPERDILSFPEVDDE